MAYWMGRSSAIESDDVDAVEMPHKFGPRAFHFGHRSNKVIISCSCSEIVISLPTIPPRKPTTIIDSPNTIFSSTLVFIVVPLTRLLLS